MLRLVEEGTLGLDDLASDHLPPELGFFDANGATIREVLAMRSGMGLNEYADYYAAEQAASVLKAFRRLPEPEIPREPRPATRASTTSCSAQSSST